MKVRELMHKPAATCPRDMALAEVARLMDVSGLGTLVVVGDDGRPTGIVTDRDLATKGYARGMPGSALVDEVMTHTVVTIDAGVDVFDAAAMMASRGVRRLPVVEAGAVVGMIAVDDLTLLLSREVSEVARAVAAQADRAHYAGWGDWDAD